MNFKVGDRAELILRSKKRVGTVEEVYNDTQKCKVQIDGFPVTVTKPQKYLVKAEGAELVVPQCVADWLNHCKQEGYNLIWSISYENNDMPDEVYEWLTSTADNQELFARAWLDGYEVEKEPLYYVHFLEGIGGYLNMRYDRLMRTNGKDQDDEYKTQFTEAEIKSMKKGKGYWLLREPVDEVDGEA
ncbi:DUF1642 domain-containing protein [Listeria monocytogenes]|uniref:DUF1642 domain-containing protein n=1 Tax=Listeria monocytogenes TaxID=1639 RepID=UPI0034A1BF72|nr:DUF1642 domain-containing protein [Listeria monocytogenes]EIM1834656.1 DUF1642 domain-containing protein [Listeria monocytogenes]EIM1903094.1 DUF1642 domain-containing protein [Listeria monocytogenes]EIM1978201.1 DUF1642 domain-containing protein [Listeria monocytogenes]EJN2699768.1 DUF1642 domain-containing protein [Listeria monocytogenes]